MSLRVCSFMCLFVCLCGRLVSVFGWLLMSLRVVVCVSFVSVGLVGCAAISVC